MQCMQPSVIVVQAEYHGFGVTVQPHSLIPVSKTPIQNAVSKILTDPAYLVSQPETCAAHISACSIQLIDIPDLQCCGNWRENQMSAFSQPS